MFGILGKILGFLMSPFIFIFKILSMIIILPIVLILALIIFKIIKGFMSRVKLQKLEKKKQELELKKLESASQLKGSSDDTSINPDKAKVEIKGLKSMDDF